MCNITDKFTPLDWLKIDIANTYGKDKLTWDKRLTWVNERTLDQLWKIIRYADEPLLYRKALIAYRDTLNGKPTGHIMHLDSVNSGHQMMAILSGCKETAKQCGLINTGKRPDLYTNTVKLMNKQLPPQLRIKLVKTGEGLKRIHVKDAIMTHNYNSKAVPKRIFNDTQLKVFYNVLSEITPGAEVAKEVINSYVEPLSSQYIWLGLDRNTVVYNVKDFIDARIEVDELDHSTFTQRFEVCMARSNDASLPANICHWLDSEVLEEVVLRCDFDITTIHDSYGVHPCNAGALVKIYREVMAELADMDILKNVLFDISGQEAVINKYSSDLSEDILNSSYALS